MKVKRKTNKSNHYGFIIVTVICLSIYFLTIGYSAFSASARIENIMASVSPVANAKITGILLSNTSNGGTSNSENFNISRIFGNIDLPNANSTVTYKVNATVFNASEMKISQITGLPSNLKYTLTDYTIGDVLCNTNNECNLGATKEFYITIGYANNGYNSSSTSYSFVMDFTFEAVNYKAKIGNTYYQTLQAAVSAVPNNTQTTVVLVNDTQEKVTVGASQNIVFNFGNHTLTNDGNLPIIENNGTIYMSDGVLQSGATQGAVNNVGTMYMTGGTINATGSKQAIFNTGTLYVSGSSNLTNTSVERAALQNEAGATLYLTGGTVTANKFHGLVNSGTLVIGTSGNVDTTTPVIRGVKYGVSSSTNYSFYDGIIKGIDGAVDDESKITAMESGYGLYHQNQTISGNVYDTMRLAIVYVVTFDANGGNVSPASRNVEAGSQIGTLPTPLRTDYTFDGWFTQANGGTQVTATTVINSSYPIYAHWTYNPQIKYAKIDSTEYASFDEAWMVAMNSNTTKTIVLLRDVTVTSTYNVNSSKSVILDLAGNTIYHASGTVIEVKNGATLGIIDSASGGKLDGGNVINGNQQVTALKIDAGGTVNISSGHLTSSKSNVIDNYGSLTITGGTFTINNVNQGILNNNAGATLNISGGSVTNTYAVEKGQAIYNKGTVNISGNVVLSSNSKKRPTVHNDASGAVINISGGTIISSNPSCERGAIQNVNNATVNITGGTITSASTNSASGAVQNAGTLVIGTKDGNINASSPVLQGEIYAVNDSKTFRFYDGILKGKTQAVNGTIDEVETNANIVNSTEVIGGETYYTAYLN